MAIRSRGSLWAALLVLLAVAASATACSREALPPLVATAAPTTKVLPAMTPNPGSAASAPATPAAPTPPPAPAGTPVQRPAPVPPVSSPPLTSPVPATATPLSSAEWPVFTDGRLGVEFRYPPECPPTFIGGTISVGPHSTLDVIETALPTLDAFVDDVARTKDWRIESRTPGTLDDHPTIQVVYRFGGLNRTGIAALVGRGSLVYAWQWAAAGSFSYCDSLAVFGHVRASFRLVDINR